MHVKPPRVAGGVKIDVSGFVAPAAKEGIYYARLTINDKVEELKFELKYHPNTVHSPEDREMKNKSSKQIFEMVEDLAFMSDRLRDVQDNVNNRANNNEKNKTVKKQADALSKKMNDILFTMAASIEGTNITGEEKLREKLGAVYAGVTGYAGRPTDSQLERMAGLKKDLEETNLKIETLYKNDLAKFNSLLLKSKIDLVAPMTKEEWDAKTKKETK
jgi:hypothetical protein